jgi:hypothetical protein
MKKILIIMGTLLLLLATAAPVGAQTPTPPPTATLTPTLTVTPEWVLPADGLQPFTYTTYITPPLDIRIGADDLITLARSALTTYTLMDWQTWALLAVVLIVSAAMVYAAKIVSHPPEI